MKSVRILCLSGSLRKVSYNTAVLQALSTLAPRGMDVVLFPAMGELPLFNPDRDEAPISSVDALRHEIDMADGLIIASPEYAHGISGVMKNALDWLVSGEAFPSMPVALINTSPRASHAQAALREVTTTMSGQIIESASISIALLGSGLDADGIVDHAEFSVVLRELLHQFRDAIIEHAHEGGRSVPQTS